MWFYSEIKVTLISCKLNITMNKWFEYYWTKYRYHLAICFAVMILHDMLYMIMKVLS